MSGHTPGPWILDDPINSHVIDDAYHVITGEDGFHIYGFMNMADAHLISAAPDLLEALKEAALQIQYLHEKFSPTGSGESVLGKCRRAIAKASWRGVSETTDGVK